MTNPIHWQHIKELAEKATPGPWWHDLTTIRIPNDNPHPRRAPIASTNLSHGIGEAGIADFNNAAYLSALDPATVLQMVAEHAAVREALERARGCIKGLLAQTPVRDVTETLAEIDDALTGGG